MSRARFRGLTLHRPWAAAIVHGDKRVENRTWVPPATLTRRGLWLAIHAGKTYDPDGAESVLGILGRLPPRHDACGIIGVARYVDAVRPEEREDDPWAVGPWCWILDDVRVVEPAIQVRGSMGLWAAEDLRRKLAPLIPEGTVTG